MVLDEPQVWQEQMLTELTASRFDGAWVRIHDSGDFFSEGYLVRWLEIMRARPRTRFYAYTKEVALFRAVVEPDPPVNFWWVFSFGGLQDASLDVARDRVADVFPGRRHQGAGEGRLAQLHFFSRRQVDSGASLRSFSR